MKKLILFTVFACIISFANAQKQMVVSAYNYTNSGQLDKALISIDKALIHPDTKDAAKTWLYRGNIYLQIHLSKEDKYKNLDTNALQKAYDSYQKAIELDVKKDYYQDLMLGLYVCGEQYYNKGVEYYDLKKYDEAMNAFDKTGKINGIFGVQDTTATYNAALCAELGKKPEKAKEYYLKLIKANYHQPLIFASLANIYLSEKDTSSALTTATKGLSIYPENLDLTICEVNIYLATGRTKDAKDLLELLTKKDPTNQVFYFNIGVLYDGFANDVSKPAEDRANYFAESVKAYKKAIELKPDYFDAIYNLGALYFNEGVRIFQEADKLTDMTKYAELQKEFEKMWADALPYLEKALELNGTDYNTLFSLKQLYSRTNQTEKLKLINDKLNK
jgi:tetratricopeptide (TPR) repeat protein